ncbi:hypothetical protein [Gilvimarinus japonicus]|uniref:NADH dehydrogenase subunit 6 n=1 Tax=Gilvimarinus japonicus TaxID=1796469 RepID=A0ABV7HQD4_9GAMM
MSVNKERIYKLIKVFYFALIPLTLMIGVYCESKPTDMVAGEVTISLALSFLPTTIGFLGAYFIRPGGNVKKALWGAFLLHYIISYLCFILMLWMFVFSESSPYDQMTAAGMSLLVTYALFYNSLIVLLVTFFGCWFYCLISHALRHRRGHR